MEEDRIVGLKLGDFGLASEVTGPLFTVCGTPEDGKNEARLWTRDAEGAMTMEARATWA